MNYELQLRRATLITIIFSILIYFEISLTEFQGLNELELAKPGLQFHGTR